MTLTPEEQKRLAVEPPFQRCFAVDIDLCVVGIQHAIGMWKSNYDSLPSIVWVNPIQIALADRIVHEAAPYLTVLADPRYEYTDWWSVGTRRDKGFGSIGA